VAQRGCFASGDDEDDDDDYDYDFFMNLISS
jgi:hypothetical protein